jgi:hypothetical protein
MGDADNFAGWAVWFGTSFAAPVVVAALVQEMNSCDLTAAQAVERVIDNPALYRIPGLGTVVNLALGSPRALLPSLGIEKRARDLDQEELFRKNL